MLLRRAGWAGANLAGALIATAATSASAQPVAQPAITAPAELSHEITSVHVTAEVPGAGAVPPEGWTPPTDPSGTVKLQHNPHQPLDVEWVRQQFDRAAAAGPIPPSTAVALLQLINRAFITAGFVNSGLLVIGHPSADGIMEVRLVYGRLASSNPAQAPVTIEWGDRHSGGLSRDYIRARFPSALERPLDASHVERDFRLLDESPAIRSISAALGAGMNPGEANLHVVVYPAQRFDFYTGVANDRSPDVGGDRLFAGGFARNLLSSGDLLTFEGGLTRGVSDGQLYYSTPFPDQASTRLSFNFGASFNDAAVITSALAPLDIRARDRSAEAGLSYQLIREPLMMRGSSRRWSPSQSLAVGVGIVARGQRSFLLGEPFSFSAGSVDGRAEYEAARLSTDYVRRDLTSVVALSVSATVGLDGTRARAPTIPNPDRRFIALLAQLNFAKRIGSGFELRGRLTGQESRGILYSGLRLPVGGSNSVRGYRESLFLVDRGAIGSLELARPFNLGDTHRTSEFSWGAFTASVFADGAAFRNAEGPQPLEHRIASVGTSLAWTPSSALLASITYAHALTHVALPNSRSLEDRGIQFRIVVHPAGII